jgi:hypothetical protein
MIVGEAARVSLPPALDPELSLRPDPDRTPRTLSPSADMICIASNTEAVPGRDTRGCKARPELMISYLNALGSRSVERDTKCFRSMALVRTLVSWSEVMAMRCTPEANRGRKLEMGLEEGMLWYGFFCDKSMISSVIPWTYCRPLQRLYAPLLLIS